MWFWRKQPLLKGYVSEIDRFLQEFDTKPEAYSTSRRVEEAKYAKISLQRDKAGTKGATTQIWGESE